MINRLNDYLSDRGISLDDSQIEKFEEYNRLLIEYNSKINLTTITDPLEVMIKHFYDSLTPAFYLDLAGKSVIDVGAGAGFPGIPLKILLPDIQLTLLDSLQKRINFLDVVVERLELGGVELIHGRAEELAQQPVHREQYDLALARAVARLNVLAELTLPLVKVGGSLLAMKASKGEEELSEATPAIKKLGGQARDIYTLELPEGSGERNLILIDKLAKTPRMYPRRPGEPARKPLT